METTAAKATSTYTNRGDKTAPLEEDLRRRLDELNYLPTTTTVALKFVELGRDPDTGANDYARVISADAALCSKILALANSSWFGVRNRVTKVPQAVSLLGLCNVRALALSYCMTGLHHELGLSQEDSTLFWEAGLCKAVAAKHYLQAFEPRTGDTAFAAGIFQDLATPVMHVLDEGETLRRLADAAMPTSERLARECEAFGMDHSEAGRLLAQKLQIPEPYIDAIAFHHDPARLEQYCESQRFAEAVRLAALLPSARTAWHPEDAAACRQIVDSQGDMLGGWDAFSASVQAEMDQLFAYFQNDAAPRLRLNAMMVRATAEIADATSAMVGQLNQMVRNGVDVSSAPGLGVGGPESPPSVQQRDGVTGLLLRQALAEQADELLQRAARYQASVVGVYANISNLDAALAEHDEAFVDFVLRETGRRFEDALGEKALMGRISDSAFFGVLTDRPRGEAEALATDLRDALVAAPCKKGNVEFTATCEAAVVWVPKADATLTVESLSRAIRTALNESAGAGEAAVFKVL
jgi:HD-like signal output (HDOD) protein/GGDEF domain-containing protein